MTTQPPTAQRRRIVSSSSGSGAGWYTTSAPMTTSKGLEAESSAAMVSLSPQPRRWTVRPAAAPSAAQAQAFAPVGAEKEMRKAVVGALPEGLDQHFFLSHFQASGGDRKKEFCLKR